LLVVGGDPTPGSSSATQDASNKADADASNRSKTDQDAKPTQRGGDLECKSGCGGNGQEQNVVQIGKTKQRADSDADAIQKALDSNTPVSILGDELQKLLRKPKTSERGTSKGYGTQGVMYL
jgi:hypothetical protein